MRIQTGMRAKRRGSGSALEHLGVTFTSVTPVRDAKGEIRYFRHGTIVTHWEIKHELPGRLRLKNPVIHRKAEICQAIEPRADGRAGNRLFQDESTYKHGSGAVRPKAVDRDQIIEILEGALATPSTPPTKRNPICTSRYAPPRSRMAAIAQFAAGVLARRRDSVCLYIDPDHESAREVLVEERRLGVDVLDAIVVVGCLGTMSIFPGAVLCWCLGFGRVLVKKTQDDSKKLLLERLR